MAGLPAFPALGELPFNQVKTVQTRYRVPYGEQPTQPYWLRYPPTGSRYDVRDRHLLGLAENPPVLARRFEVRTGGQTLELVRPVARRFSDHMRGEMTQPFVIVPRMSLEMPSTALVFLDSKPRTVEVGVIAKLEQRGRQRGVAGA